MTRSVPLCVGVAELRERIILAFKVRSTCSHIAVTSITQSGRCDECTADVVLSVVSDSDEPDWMGIQAYGPPDLTLRFLDFARELGFTDSPVDFCEMEHQESGAHLDFFPVPPRAARRKEGTDD